MVDSAGMWEQGTAVGGGTALLLQLPSSSPPPAPTLDSRRSLSLTTPKSLQLPFRQTRADVAPRPPPLAAARELWYRASLAWQSLLDPPAETTSTLVVAHNAVNQALICTALGLPASYFRTINQSNAAVTTIVLQPSSPRGDSPTAILQSLNASPNRPFKENEDPISRMVLVPAVSGTGAAIAATASFLQGLPMQHVLCAGGGPAESAAAVLSSMHELEGANGGGERSSSSNSSSGDESDTNSVVSVSSSSSAGSNGASPPCSVVMMEEAFRAGTAEEQGRQLFKQARGLLETSPQSTIAVVATPSALAALVCCALGLSPFASASRFRLDPCSVSLVQYPKGPLKRVEIKCLNYTAHLSNA